MTRIPEFTAEASLYLGNAYFQTGAVSPVFRPDAQGLVQPALAKRRRFFCGLKACCYDLRDLGLGAGCFDRETGEPA